MNIADFLLNFSHDAIIIPILILGFIWLDRTIFYHVTCLILLSIIFNFALKITFQISLLSLGKEGFSFPSGHMQASTILYGWLIYQIPNIIFRLLIFVLLIGIGISLVYRGYHQYYDVLGGIFFACLLMSLYYYLLLKIPKMTPWLTIGISTILMACVYMRYGEPPKHLWMAYYALLGFVGSEKAFNKEEISLSISNTVLTSVICVILIFLVRFIFNKELNGLPIFLYQLQWLLIGFLAPFSIFCANFILKKYVKLVGNRS